MTTNHRRNGRAVSVLALLALALPAGSVLAECEENIAFGKSVSLHGAPFFTGGWGGGMIVDPSTVTDGVFLPEQTQWDQGGVWWDSQDGADRWLQIALDGEFEICSFLVQADDNDAYELFYWDLGSASWQLAWDVPNYDLVGWGLLTRDEYILDEPIVTNALMFQGNLNDSDGFFSVSEIQAFGTPVPIPAYVDIKPGSCPNPLNRGSNGVLPVALVGTDGLDVTNVDLSSVAIARADGVGGAAFQNEGPPGPHSVFDDTAAPFEGGPCACHEMRGDGLLDLNLFFRTQELVAALELDGLAPGALVELVLSGALLDGTAFTASDCVRLVPPAPPVDADTILISYFYSFIHTEPLIAMVRPGETFIIYDAIGGCGPVFHDIAACEVSLDGEIRAWNHDCLSGDGPGTYGPWVSNGCSTAEEFGFIVECCVLSGDAAALMSPRELVASARMTAEAIYDLCAEDLDADGDVGFADLTRLLSAWGACSKLRSEDLDGDGHVGFVDLTAMLSRWGPCGAWRPNAKIKAAPTGQP